MSFVNPVSGGRLTDADALAHGASCVSFVAHARSLSQLKALVPELEWRGAGDLTYGEYADLAAMTMHVAEADASIDALG